MSFSGEKQNDIGHASWQSDHCLAFTRISLFQFADIDGMFGAMCPTQLNHVIASFKRGESSGIVLFPTCFVIWLSYQPIELTILSGCSCPAVKTSLSIQKKPAFFPAQSNICLINCPATIKKYGSLCGIWEGEDETFARCVKLEISTM
jgi:hypothetical protein